MDRSHRGRILYAYLMWAFIKGTTADEYYDPSNIDVEEVVVVARENVTLNCPGVTKDLLIQTLEWHANDKRLLVYSNNVTTIWHDQIRLSLVNYALHFHPVIANDSGNYKCLVNNRNAPETIIRLIVQDVPDPPGRPTISRFTSNSSGLSWVPAVNSHNSPILHYVIETHLGGEEEAVPDPNCDTRFEDGGEKNTTYEIVTPTNDTTYTVENLKPFTVYSFRVSAVNEIGRSKPSIKSFFLLTLRELPEGKPIITDVYNTSSTSVFLSWTPPCLSTIHGEFLGYRIRYKPRHKVNAKDIDIYLRDPAVRSHVIRNLEPYTQYLVSLQVFNMEGHGPATTVHVMTDEGVPMKPLNLTSGIILSTTIELAWIQPERVNGVLDGYRVYYRDSNHTNAQMCNGSDGPVIEFVLKDLQPYTIYEIWVKAYTRKNEGTPSDHITRRTDITGPDAPLIQNLTCQTDQSIFLQWSRPKYFWGSIDYYYIQYRMENAKFYKEIELVADKDHLEIATIIPNLTMNAIYEFVVRGGTRSTINTLLIIQGEKSTLNKIHLTPNCDKLPSLLHSSNRDFTPGVIAGMVCACFAAVLLMTSFILWKPIFRRCFHTAYYFLDYPPRTAPTLQEWENSEQDGEKTAVAIQQFVQHVASLHADGDIGFTKEYEAIQAKTGEHAAENSQYAENKTKNRYMNILAYDHSRVQLLSCGSGQPKKGNDYVNANYIDGWQRARAYIGTQGPLPPTFDGFWRMVWEQRVSIVVMITNLIERGRKKCDMYWPGEGTETYGFIQVTLLKEDIMATYTIRTLQIRHLKVKKKKNGTNMGERIIWQYHYTGWPDHGVPEHPLPVLSFIRKSSNANPPDAGPIVVHCSAGVGRTGTYIAIDSMLRQAKSKGEINVFGFLKHIRTQRNFLVQTEEQYIFIHYALQEAIESGETNIEADNLMQHIHDMLNPANNEAEGLSKLEAEYKLVTSRKPKELNLISATKPWNVAKNRNSEIVSIETARVHLTPKPGVEGSDYINATWIPGFNRNREFVLTQHPMESTIMEFWQMMWDHNVHTVVMLTQCNDEYPEFWPTETNDIESDTFRVRACGVKETMSGIIIREVAVRSLQDDYELSAKILHRQFDQGPFWPHNENPRAFVNLLHDLHRDYQNGPIAVLDRYGGLEAAIFILVTTLNKQLEYEKCADIYMYSKLLYMKRPGIFQKMDDYVLLYQCLESMLTPQGRDEPDLYAMANGHVSSIADPNEVMPTTSIEHAHEEFTHQTPMIREYTTVGITPEYMSDYTMPMTVEHPLEPSSSRINETCISSGHMPGGELDKNVIIGHRNVTYHNHPAGISVTIDANGYITNGNMHVQPEGMQTNCKVMPQ